LLKNYTFYEKYFENGKAAAPSLTLPIEILINARRFWESLKNKKEVISDLFSDKLPYY